MGITVESYRKNVDAVVDVLDEVEVTWRGHGEKR